jgi:hypothetical protein
MQNHLVFLYPKLDKEFSPMKKKHFRLIEVVSQEPPDRLAVTQLFLQNYQTALLLSLLDKSLLTKRQFDQCMEELKKQTGSK